MMILRGARTTIVGTYFLGSGKIYCRGGSFLLSLLTWSLLLLIIIINFLPCMIIKMMHPWTKKALHDLRTSGRFMLTCLETHITCIVLLALLRFIICCIFSNFSEACVMSISFTENAIYWCERSSIAYGLCNISIH